MNRQLLHEQIKKIIEKSKDFDKFWIMYTSDTDNKTKQVFLELFHYTIPNELLGDKAYIKKIHQNLHFINDSPNKEENLSLKLGNEDIDIYEVLEKYSYLNQIDIGIYEPNRKILEHIHAISSLNILEFFDSQKQTPLNLNQINWKYLDKLRGLIILSDNDIIGFDALKELINIRFVKICNLHNKSYTPKNLSTFKNLTNLKMLILNQLNIENENIDNLKNCSSLFHLDLAYNQIKDISAVENLTQLNVLRLDSNPINNIEPITKLHSLKRLQLTDCGLTETQIAYLKQSLPNCQISA